MSNRLTERQRALAKLIEILLNLKNQMCRLGVPIFLAFENLGREKMGGIWSEVLQDCGDIMRIEHLDTGKAWKIAVEKNKENIPLEESDWTVISDFGELLGKSDRQNQESVLDLAKENLDILEKKAREAIDTKGRLYRNMGILSGAAVVILLI